MLCDVTLLRMCLVFGFVAAVFWVTWWRSFFDFGWVSMTGYALLSAAALVLFLAWMEAPHCYFALVLQSLVTAFFGLKAAIRDKTVFRD
jgi:hypothetical protein